MYRTKRNLRPLLLLYLACTLCSSFFFMSSKSLAEQLYLRDKHAASYSVYDLTKDKFGVEKRQAISNSTVYLSERPTALGMTTDFISRQPVVVDIKPQEVIQSIETTLDAQETETVVETTEEPELEIFYTEDDVIILAKVIEAEAGGISSFAERAAVAWCILNRVDYTGSEYSFPSTIAGCATESGQFAYYSYTQYSDESYEIAADVLERWNLEQNGFADVGRTLPSEYLFFSGDGSHNHFRTDIGYGNGSYDWSLGSPYAEDN